MNYRHSIFWLITVFFFAQCSAQQPSEKTGKYELSQLANELILPGAYDLDAYLPILQGKRVAILGNQTSEVNGVLLPDLLLEKQVRVVKLFSPEHGFRGKADAGAKVSNDRDPDTGLPIISLYGKNKEISSEQLKDVDILIYDLQDVGVRFYTYISTLEYAMKACARYGKKLIILDRPNPLPDVVDGPVLQPQHKSFVGMQQVPIAYAMTPGEYAQMLVGERWVAGVQDLDYEVIKIKNYTRDSRYTLPIAPSPNLKSMTAIYLYPSTCLFEGTVLSLGRGTPYPFQQYGHPSLERKYDYSFTPTSMVGATNPPLLGKTCFGAIITKDEQAAYAIARGGINLTYLIEAYQAFPDKPKFFNSFFEKLAGTDQLRQQIISGKTAAEIKASWQPALDRFEKIRAKYLLY